MGPLGPPGRAAIQRNLKEGKVCRQRVEVKEGRAARAMYAHDEGEGCARWWRGKFASPQHAHRTMLCLDLFTSGAASVPRKPKCNFLLKPDVCSFVTNSGLWCWLDITITGYCRRVTMSTMCAGKYVSAQKPAF